MSFRSGPMDHSSRSVQTRQSYILWNGGYSLTVTSRQHNKFKIVRKKEITISETRTYPSGSTWNPRSRAWWRRNVPAMKPNWVAGDLGFMITLFWGDMDVSSDDWGGRRNVSFRVGDTDEDTVRVVFLIVASSATEFKGKLAVGIWERGLYGDSLVYIIVCFRQARWNFFKWWRHWITNNCMSLLPESTDR